MKNSPLFKFHVVISPLAYALLACIVLLPAGGCFLKPNKVSLDRISAKTMGTHYQVTWVARSKSPTREELFLGIEKRLERVNALMSTYRKDSELSRFNQYQSTDWFPVSSETLSVVEEALQTARLTQGAFDISVGPLVDKWGFGPSGRITTFPTKVELARAKKLVDFEKIKVQKQPPALRKLSPKMRLDLSGIAKGYGVDVLSEYLIEVGFKDHLVDIGGELRANGSKLGKPWQIAIELPQVGTRVIHKVISLRNMAMATSGDYRNYFEREGKRFSHMIDPRLGSPIDHKLASVTVLDSSCKRADSLATGLMVMGFKKGFELAKKHKWAAQFLVKEGEGFVEKTTLAFEGMVHP